MTHSKGQWLTGIQSPTKSDSGSIEIHKPVIKIFVKDDACFDGEKTIALIGDVTRAEAIANAKIMACSLDMLELLEECKKALDSRPRGLLYDREIENYQLVQKIQALQSKTK